MEKKLNLDLQPRTKSVTLPSSKRVDVVIHDFKNCLFSLLSDKDLMNPANSLLCKTQPWVKQNITGGYADIDSGVLWSEGWSRYCDSNKKEVLCPILFFIDKTHTDVQGKLSLEPVCFTLGIFNRKTRNKSHAWRTIGYVPNFDLLSKYKGKAEEKIRDYHFVLSTIFEDIYIAQKSNGLPCVLFDKKCILKVPVLSFLGDTEGHDKLVGRLGSRNKVPTICRYCDCQRESSSDERLISNYIQQETIHSGGEILKTLGYYNITNACHSLQYCDPERGIHGATPGEIVHVLQHGLIPYIFNAFARIKANTKKELQDEKKNVKNNAEVYDDPDDDTKNRRNVFSDDVATIFEARAKATGKILQRQSDRNLPRTYFPQGILPSRYKQKKDGKKMAAHEQSGVLIVSLFCMFNYGFLHHHLNKKLSFKRHANWISVLEKMLLFENLLKAEYMSKQQQTLLKNYIPLLMDLIKRIVKRRTGAQWNIVKFHLLTHLADDIERNGVYENVSTGPCESHHKTSAKNPAKNTQHISGVFHEQVGKQYANNLLLDIYTRRNGENVKEKKYFNEPQFNGQSFQFVTTEENDGFYQNGGFKKFFL